MQIFLSHSSDDRNIAKALAKLLRDLFGKPVTVVYSSEAAAGGGVPSGAEWYPWIKDQISAADKTFVLLTPNSLHKPWVLWESGVALGVALASGKKHPVVPMRFGVEDKDVPSPFHGTQWVRGDSDEDAGIRKLLGELNQELDGLLTQSVFETVAEKFLPIYLQAVLKTLQDAAPTERLLQSVPSDFDVKKLGGSWVSCFDFVSGGKQRHHADIVSLVPRSQRRLTGLNTSPRTEGHKKGFKNTIDVELVDRHLVGHWKNLSDTRYFGTLQLAVMTGEDVMRGYYTSLASDVEVGTGAWKWVRLDKASLEGADLAKLRLRAPAEVHAQLDAHGLHNGPIGLDDVREGK